MITKRILYKDFADKNGINRALRTVKGSYDETTKTIEVLIGDPYDEEADKIIMAMRSVEAYREDCAAEGIELTEEEAQKEISENMEWLCAALDITQKEAIATLAML